MVIRKLEEKDINTVVELWYNVSVQAHDFISSEYWAKHKYAMRTQYLPDSESFLAVEEGRIVGFVSMLDTYLAAIFVHIDSQGAGIGKNLLEHVKGFHETIQLKVYKKNTASVQFYLKQKFVIVSEEAEESTNEIEYLMEWKKQ